MSKINVSVYDDAVDFSETKEWSNVGTVEEEAQRLNGFMIYDSIVTVNGLYLIMEEINPGKNLGEEITRIVKITTDEETGKLELRSMDVTEEQARAFACSGEWEDD